MVVSNSIIKGETGFPLRQITKPPLSRFLNKLIFVSNLKHPFQIQIAPQRSWSCLCLLISFSLGSLRDSRPIIPHISGYNSANLISKVGSHFKYTLEMALVFVAPYMNPSKGLFAFENIIAFNRTRFSFWFPLIFKQHIALKKWKIFTNCQNFSEIIVKKI